MAQERPEEHEVDPPVAPPAVPPAAPVSPPAVPPAASGVGWEPPLRLTVPVPPEVRAAFRRAEQDPSVEVHRVIGALFRKLTPERGPEDKGPLPGEVYYFQRLFDAPTETLSLPEQDFVLLVRMQEELAERARMAGSDRARRLHGLLERRLAKVVAALQDIIRTERGKDAAQLEWESNGP